MIGYILDGDVRRLLDKEELEGERRTNRVRLILAALFLIIFVAFYLKSESHYTAGYVIFGSLVALFLYAVALRVALARDYFRSFIKYVTFAVDTACITVLSVASVFLSSGLEIKGWIPNFALFVLFVVLSGLQFSPGLCLFVGMLTTAEFLLLNLFVSRAGGQPLPVPQLAAMAILLLAAGVVVALTARATRQLIVRAGTAERQRALLVHEADRAKRLAETDDLTGLYNRRFFMVELNRERARSSRLQKPFAVAIIDLDNFKQVNDSLGHLAGDLVLRQVSGTLRRHSREADIVARFGGDEFALILCDANSQQAGVAAQRMCKAVREHEFELDGEVHDIRVTLSVGIACFPEDDTDVEGLLRAADRALYRAKALGRDRTVFARDLSEEPLHP